jgi:hypothetical protein
MVGNLGEGISTGRIQIRAALELEGLAVDVWSTRAARKQSQLSPTTAVRRIVCFSIQGISFMFLLLTRKA